MHASVGIAMTLSFTGIASLLFAEQTKIVLTHNVQKNSWSEIQVCEEWRWRPPVFVGTKRIS